MMNIKQWITYWRMNRDYKKLDYDGKKIAKIMKRTPEDYKKQFN